MIPNLPRADRAEGSAQSKDLPPELRQMLRGLALRGSLGTSAAVGWMQPLGQLLGVFARWEKPGSTLQMNFEVSSNPGHASRGRELNEELRPP